METPAGLRIARVLPGGYAEEAGLLSGDLLISLGGATTYTRSDISFVERQHAAGEKLEAVSVRAGAVRCGRGRLSGRYFSETRAGKAA